MTRMMVANNGGQVGSPFFIALSVAILAGFVYCLDATTGTDILQCLWYEVRFF
jgi:hypothetical protein